MLTGPIFIVRRFKTYPKLFLKFGELLGPFSRFCFNVTLSSMVLIQISPEFCRYITVECEKSSLTIPAGCRPLENMCLYLRIFECQFRVINMKDSQRCVVVFGEIVRVRAKGLWFRLKFDGPFTLSARDSPFFSLSCPFSIFAHPQISPVPLLQSRISLSPRFSISSDHGRRCCPRTRLHRGLCRCVFEVSPSPISPILCVCVCGSACSRDLPPARNSTPIPSQYLRTLWANMALVSPCNALLFARVVTSLSRLVPAR